MNTDTIFTPVESIRGSSTGTVAAFKRAARRIQRALLKRHWERHTVQELSALPSYVLRDIGISRDDIRILAADMAEERAEAWARRAGGSNGFGG